MLLHEFLGFSSLITSKPLFQLFFSPKKKKKKKKKKKRKEQGCVEGAKKTRILHRVDEWQVGAHVCLLPDISDGAPVSLRHMQRPWLTWSFVTWIRDICVIITRVLMCKVIFFFFFQESVQVCHLYCASIGICFLKKKTQRVFEGGG